MNVVVTALTSFAALAVVFGVLEWAWPARRQRLLRAGYGTDVAFFAGQYLVITGLITSALALVARALSVPVHDGRGIELLARALLALMLGDLVVYWFHRACHHFDWLWRFHRVHHTTTELDWLAAHREHPLDGLLTALCVNLPGIALGLPFEAIGGLVAFRSVWAIFIHSNVRLPLGPLRYVLGAPEIHRHHHACAPRTAHNFANLAPWLDLTFGTFHLPAHTDYPLGVDEPAPRGYVALLLSPFRRRQPSGGPGVGHAPTPQSG